MVPPPPVREQVSKHRHAGPAGVAALRLMGSAGLDQLTGMNVTTKIDTSDSANPRPESRCRSRKTSRLSSRLCWERRPRDEPRHELCDNQLRFVATGRSRQRSGLRKQLATSSGTIATEASDCLELALMTSSDDGAWDEWGSRLGAIYELPLTRVRQRLRDVMLCENRNRGRESRGVPFLSSPTTKLRGFGITLSGRLTRLIHPSP